MRTSNRLGSLVAAAALLVASLVLIVPFAAADSPGGRDSPVSTPRVQAAPHGQQGFPFMASTLNLARAGYVEQEFLISGTAQAYIPVTLPLQPDGRWNVKPNPGVTAPYTTRILVRRPIDPKRFNGTVLVEWFNEAARFDAPGHWLYTHDEIMREGYAYVAVTAQFVGVKALLGWESGPGARYATLFHPGESFAYDIFAQAGWVITHARDGDPRPLGNLTSEAHTVLAAGFSQAAAWLATYFNAMHRLSPVYGGFLIHDGGWTTPISLDVGSFYGDPIPGNVPVTPFIDTPYFPQLRTDLSVPALILQSEEGLSDYGNGAGRTFHLQPDSAHVRVWELAGAPHLETGWIEEFTADARKSNHDLPTADQCGNPPGIANIIHGQGARAALNVLKDWSNDEEAPRSAPRLSLVVPDPPDSYDTLVAFNRDPATNLVIGGIRLPPVAVPIATLDGNRSDLDLDLPGVCWDIGSIDPWNHDSDPWDGQTGLDPSPTPEPDLQLLYGTHTDYVLRVGAAAAGSVARRFLRPADALAAVAAAQKASVP